MVRARRLFSRLVDVAAFAVAIPGAVCMVMFYHLHEASDRIWSPCDHCGQHRYLCGCDDQLADAALAAMCLETKRLEALAKPEFVRANCDECGGIDVIRVGDDLCILCRWRPE